LLATPPSSLPLSLCPVFLSLSVCPLQSKTVDEGNFEVDTKDPRFEAMFVDSQYAMDPTSSDFLPTAGSRALLEERGKRRMRMAKK
jgi:hypothetical protein